MLVDGILEFNKELEELAQDDPRKFMKVVRALAAIYSTVVMASDGPLLEARMHEEDIETDLETILTNMGAHEAEA